MTLASLHAQLLTEDGRAQAIETIRSNHYTKSVPSGKSYYISVGTAIVVWSIPANRNIAKYLLGWNGCVWELSRLYAPDGHKKNLLTRAISLGVQTLRSIEPIDALVSYADPNVGHQGGVYRAASWIYHGQCEKTRMYVKDGKTVARRAFHSGKKCLRKSEIEAMGWREVYQTGKHRYVKPISRRARKVLRLPPPAKRGASRN